MWWLLWFCYEGQLLLNITKSRVTLLAVQRSSKKIYHILVNSHLKILQNCKVFWSAEFLVADHRIVATTLKLNIKWIILACKNSVFHLQRLNGLACAHEYVVTVLNFKVQCVQHPWRPFGTGVFSNMKLLILQLERSALESAWDLWVALPQGGCWIILRSHTARLGRNQDQDKTLSHGTRVVLRRNKAMYVRSLDWEAEGYFSVNDVWPA